MQATPGNPLQVFAWTTWQLLWGMEVEETEVFIKNKTTAGFEISNTTTEESRLRKAVSSLYVGSLCPVAKVFL